MSKTLKRVLAMALVICALMSYTVPAAYAAILDDSFATNATYNFDLSGEYNGVPADPNGKTNPFAYILTGNVGTSTQTKSIPARFASGNLNWTYEAANAGICGSTTEDEHLPLTSGNRMLGEGLRSTVGEGGWLAFRIKSPGAGEFTMDLNFYGQDGSPTVAIYIWEAENEAITDLTTTAAHDEVLLRQKAIHAKMDPENRVGKANLNAGTTNKANTATIGKYTFEKNKEYIVVIENYEAAAMAGNYTYLTSLYFTTGSSTGTVLEGEDEIGSILVKENVVPASDGGYMGAVQEVKGHDYYFLPLEGGKMAIYDLDKFIAGEEGYLIKTVTTGLYYPTHATVTDNGKVIIGGDGKRLFIFDTNTMTGRTTPDFRSTDGLKSEGHNQGSHYGSDGYLYFGTLYGGHLVQYDIDARTYVDLGDVVTASVRALAGITANTEEESGGVRATYYHNGYLYAKVDSDNYTLVVKQDVANKTTVAAIDVTELMHGSGTPHGLTVLGDKYLIAGGSSASGMVLIDLATFTLVEYDDVVRKGLFSSKSDDAEAAWVSGMSGHASEVIDGKQYFCVNSSLNVYSYDVETGEMAMVGKNFRPLRTGQKTAVTLDTDQDGTEETWLLTFAGGGQPRLFNPATGKTKSLSGFEVNMDEAGGSSINIGDYYNDVLYIGAWNNWNCAAFDTKTETFSSHYVTGGQTDSQVSYVDENGQFHLVSGNYSACVVYEIDPLNKTGYDGDADTNIIKPLISNMKKYDQKRIHTVEYGDGYVFAGTIPGSYINGGGVGTYNVATGKEDFLHFKKNSTAGEKTVPAEFSELWDLSVKGIVYSDGRLYGATTRAGGSGSGVVDGTSAQIFVMDYENMAIEATLDLRDYLDLLDSDGDGVEDPISYVGGISADPVVEGRLWGIVSNVLFCFEYDKTTKTFTVQEILAFENKEYQSSGGVGQHNRKIIFDTATNSAFVAFFNYGMYQIKITDWNAAVGSLQISSSEQILKSAPETYAFGANNNLYYASGTDLYMKPVNVTSSDWTAAQAVDAQINALGMVTADDADAVAAAKAAYNNLSLRDKALVQESRALLEAEAQVLELRIEAAIANVTAGSQDELGALIVQYNELEADQQRYVQNFPDLENAYDTAIELVNNAADVQEQINTLPDVVTLTDEAAVVAAREAYDALTDEQKALVDDAKLVDAETQIILLKAAGTVQEQINALPDSVTLSDEAAVVAARSAYDALTDAQKATIDTAKLVAAEARLVALKAAAEVQAKIDALPDEITLENEAAVKAARKAYNALTAEGQAEVDTTKLVAAEAKLAELAAAVAVQAQIDALPDAIVIEDITAVAVARAAYEALSDALKAMVNTEKLEAAEAALAELEKNAVPTQVVYDFELYRNPDFYTDCTKYAYDETAGRIATNFNASKTYNNTYTIEKWFFASYPKTINWGVETSGASNNGLADYTFRGELDQAMRLITLSAGQYISLRIFVPAAGLYTVDLKGGQVGGTFDVYMFPASTVYATQRTPASTLTAAMTEENRLVDNLALAAEAKANVGQWDFQQAGDYIVLFKLEADNTKGISFRNITLTPVIDETTAVAMVGDELFLSLNEALAYQVENGAEAVLLNRDLEVGDLVLEPNAVLDLNGKTLTVDSVLSYSSSAIIDSSEKDTGVLKINDAEGNMLSSDNAQLPIYDAAAEGYRFFEISVKSVAVTGKGGENPKYWFKVSAVNFDELYKLIQAGSELDIAVKMTWNGGEADAVAGADFLKQWADAFSNNESIYITVSAVNTEGLENFSLTPCMTANGVAIEGNEL